MTFNFLGTTAQWVRYENLFLNFKYLNIYLDLAQIFDKPQKFLRFQIVQTFKDLNPHFRM